MAYDSIGRNLYTAELSSTSSHSHYMTYFADMGYVEHYGNNPSNISIPGTGYNGWDSFMRQLQQVNSFHLILNRQ